MQGWVIAVLILFLAVLLLAIGGGFYLLLQAIQDLKTPQPAPPGPVPSVTYQQLAREAIAEDTTGLADEYLAALFFSASQGLNAPPVVAGMTTRKTFSNWLQSLGQTVRYLEQYNFNLGPLILQGFAWMEKAGPFTAEDRARASRELQQMGVAFDSI